MGETPRISVAGYSMPPTMRELGGTIGSDRGASPLLRLPERGRHFLDDETLGPAAHGG